MRRGQRMAALGLAVAVGTGLAGAAAGDAAGAAAAAPAGKSDAAASPEPAKSGPGESRAGSRVIDTAALARRFGVSQAALERALDDAKRVASGLPEGGRDSTWLHPAVVAVVARDLGLSPAGATGVLRQLPWFSDGAGRSTSGKVADEPVPAAVVADVARSLQVSAGRVRAALQRLAATQAPAGRVTSAGSGFAAAARSLGVSPQVLENALRTAKQHLVRG